MPTVKMTRDRVAAALGGSPLGLEAFASADVVAQRRVLHRLLSFLARSRDFRRSGLPSGHWAETYEIHGEWLRVPGSEATRLALFGGYSDQGLTRSYGADFERLATGGAVSRRQHYQVVRHTLGDVSILVETETDAMSTRGRSVELKTFSGGMESFLASRAAGVFIQMVLGGSDFMALGLHSGGKLHAIRRLTPRDLKRNLPPLKRWPVLLGRLAALLHRIQKTAHKHGVGVPLSITLEGKKLAIQPLADCGDGAGEA